MVARIITIITVITIVITVIIIITIVTVVDTVITIITDSVILITTIPIDTKQFCGNVVAESVTSCYYC